jgi:hypothetical protein
MGDVGIILLFCAVAVVCFVLAPVIGNKFGWTVPNKDRADYVIRAQATLISFIALILAFSLVQAQNNLRRVDEMVAKEASSLNTFDRQLLRYGEQGAALRPLLWDYTTSIIDDEWPTLKHGVTSPITSKKLTPMSRATYQLEPQPGRQTTIYGEMLKSLDDLADQREQRINAADLHLPSEFWLMALLLGALLVALSTVIEPVAYHTVSIVVQGVALALLAAIVFCSDRPFEGDTSVTPAAISHALATMKARV